MVPEGGFLVENSKYLPIARSSWTVHFTYKLSVDGARLERDSNRNAHQPTILLGKVIQAVIAGL